MYFSTKNNKHISIYINTKSPYMVQLFDLSPFPPRAPLGSRTSARSSERCRSQAATCAAFWRKWRWSYCSCLGLCLFYWDSLLLWILNPKHMMLCLATTKLCWMVSFFLHIHLQSIAIPTLFRGSSSGKLPGNFPWSPHLLLDNSMDWFSRENFHQHVFQCLGVPGFPGIASLNQSIEYCSLYWWLGDLFHYLSPIWYSFYLYYFQ